MLAERGLERKREREETIEASRNESMEAVLIYIAQQS